MISPKAVKTGKATRASGKRSTPLTIRAGSTDDNKSDMSEDVEVNRIRHLEDTVTTLVAMVTKSNEALANMTKKNDTILSSPTSSETIGTSDTKSSSGGKPRRAKQINDKTIASAAKSIFYHRMKNSDEIRSDIVDRLKSVGMCEERTIPGTKIAVPKIPWQLIRKATDALFEGLDNDEKSALLDEAKAQLLSANL